MKKTIKIALIVLFTICLVYIFSGNCNADSDVGSKYQEENGVIYRIMPETSISVFESNIELPIQADYNIDIYDSINKFEKIKTGNIKTGYIASIYPVGGLIDPSLIPELTMDYSLSVIGDVNGDGNVDAIDLTRVIKYIIGKTDSISEKAQLKSADVDGNSKIDVIDITGMIIKIVKGKFKFETNPVVVPDPEPTEPAGSTATLSVRYTYYTGGFTYSNPKTGEYQSYVPENPIGVDIDNEMYIEVGDKMYNLNGAESAEVQLTQYLTANYLYKDFTINIPVDAEVRIGTNHQEVDWIFDGNKTKYRANYGMFTMPNNNLSIEIENRFDTDSRGVDNDVRILRGSTHYLQSNMVFSNKDLAG